MDKFLNTESIHVRPAAKWAHRLYEALTIAGPDGYSVFYVTMTNEGDDDGSSEFKITVQSRHNAELTEDDLDLLREIITPFGRNWVIQAEIHTPTAVIT